VHFPSNSQAQQGTFWTQSTPEATIACNRQSVHGLIRVGVALWQTEDGRAMFRRLLHEFRTTAPCETTLPPVEPEDGQG
jgi:hypothetical protein